MINSFWGRYRFLSNFYPCDIDYEGMLYPSSEHAYQAAKCENITDRRKFLSGTAGNAKRLGKNIIVRKDWDTVKLSIMEEIVRIKFKNPEVRNLLLATNDLYIEEGNGWGDTFWGVCKGKGQNHLGKILMKIRKEIQDEMRIQQSI